MHHLQHIIQSTPETVKKQKRYLNFPIIVFNESHGTRLARGGGRFLREYQRKRGCHEQAEPIGSAHTHYNGNPVVEKMCAESRGCGLF